jgi:hypothetical protein
MRLFLKTNHYVRYQYLKLCQDTQFLNGIPTSFDSRTLDTKAVAQSNPLPKHHGTKKRTKFAQKSSAKVEPYVIRLFVDVRSGDNIIIIIFHRDLYLLSLGFKPRRREAVAFKLRVLKLATSFPLSIERSQSSNSQHWHPSSSNLPVEKLSFSPDLLLVLSPCGAYFAKHPFHLRLPKLLSGHPAASASL